MRQKYQFRKTREPRMAYLEALHDYGIQITLDEHMAKWGISLSQAYVDRLVYPDVFQNTRV